MLFHDRVFPRLSLCDISGEIEVQQAVKPQGEASALDRWYCSQLGANMVQHGVNFVPVVCQLGAKMVQYGVNFVPVVCQHGTKTVPTWCQK